MTGFGILRLVLLTSILYVALAVLVELSFFAVAHFTGSVLIMATKGGWWLFFALLWLASFSLAWHFAPMNSGHIP